MRMFISTLLAAAALAGLTAGAAPAGESQAPDRELTVATYNIHHAAGVDGRLDLERVATEIERGGAEVVGLQEVDRHWSDRSEFVDQAQWLADRLGMEVVYGANLDLDPPAPGQPRRQYGTAILSDYPIVYSHNTHLPRPEGGEQRGLLEAAIDVGGVRIRVANTHLQHTSAVERRAQTERIVELLRPVDTPIVLMGDLNARPEAPELAPLWPRFVDAWPSGGEGDGFTYPSEAPGTPGSTTCSPRRTSTSSRRRSSPRRPP